MVEVWIVSGSQRFFLSRAVEEDQAVVAAMQLLEDVAQELRERRLLITKAPDLPLGA
jgi:hypothetical protein